MLTCLDKTAYEYWTGSSWRTNDEEAAAVVVPAPVGELSVRWNSYYHKWLMMYLNEHTRAIVLRTSDQLTGPWGEERVVVSATEHLQLYAPYITPRWNDGPDIFFTMSLNGPYNVYLMRAMPIGLTPTPHTWHRQSPSLSSRLMTLPPTRLQQNAVYRCAQAGNTASAARNRTIAPMSMMPAANTPPNIASATTPIASMPP